MAKCLSCMCGRVSDDESDSGDEDMRLESHRLDSLLAIKDLCVNPQALAIQGFFARGQAFPDEVECVFCHIRLGSWDHDDDPVREHLRNSNNCPLLRGTKTQNVPLNEALLQRLLKRVSRQYLSVPLSPYCIEENRLESFRDIVGWDNTKELARWGFFCVDARTVECIFCHMRLETKTAGDTVARHLEASDCPLLTGRASTNVPLDATLTDRLIYEIAGQRPSSDALVLPAETYAAQTRHKMPQRDPRRVSIVSNPLSERYIHAPNIKNLHMEINRLSTFRYWRGRVDKYQLSRLGFFYTGNGDSVQCIFCRVQMSNWHPDADILTEHLSRTNCPLMRGLPTSNVPRDPQALNRILDDAYDVTPAHNLHQIRPEVSEDSVRSDNICKVCYDRACEIVFLPCRHASLCSKCASCVDRCPFCQQPGQVVELFYM